MTVDPYTGRAGGGNYGRGDFMDVTEQDTAVSHLSLLDTAGSRETFSDDKTPQFSRCHRPASALITLYLEAPSSPCTSCFSRGARRQGLLPDWLAGFFYDKSVGGPQRDLESIVATQLFFATFILTPAVLYGSGVIHFD